MQILHAAALLTLPRWSLCCWHVHTACGRACRECVHVCMLAMRLHMPARASSTARAACACTPDVAQCHAARSRRAFLTGLLQASNSPDITTPYILPDLATCV